MSYFKNAFLYNLHIKRLCNLRSHPSTDYYNQMITLEHKIKTLCIYAVLSTNSSQ